jgi:6-phosphogluconolactonase
MGGFSVNTATGALSPVPGSPQSSVSAAAVLAIDPTGKFLYVGGNGGVAAYSIDAASGELTAVPGSPVNVDGVPYSAAIDASGKFLIVSTSPPPGGAPGNCLAVLSIDPSNGTVTPVPGSPFGPLQTCGTVVADPSAEYVYAGSSGTVSVLSIDQATGELALVNQATLPGALPGARAVSSIALTH